MECSCCGHDRFEHKAVLWSELIAEWSLAPYEVEYIERQQGTVCVACGSNLCSMALAVAIMQSLDFRGIFRDSVCGEGAAGLRVLEINEAGGLTPFLREVPGHLLQAYPHIDMMELPFGSESFDLVVHSDTLEHIPNPVRGLSECRRVLKEGGFCAFTVPIVVDRLTRSREGLAASYHGSPTNPDDCLVRTEYGADACKHVLQAGFSECRIVGFEYPAAQALVGVK